MPPRILFALLALAATLPAQSPLTPRTPADRALLINIVPSGPVDPATLVITDDTQPIPAALLRPVSLQPALVLVLDALNANPQQLSLTRLALNDWLKAAPPPLPVSIVYIGMPSGRSQPGDLLLEKGHLLLRYLPPTQDSATLLQGLHDAIPPALGLQSNFDPSDRTRFTLEAVGALAQSLGTLSSAVPVSFTVALLTPGWSSFAPNPRANTALFNYIVYLNQLFTTSHILLEDVDNSGFAYPNSGPYRAALAPVLSPEQANAAALSPPVLALHSGGLVLSPTGSIPAHLTQCAQDALHVLTFAYTPPLPTSTGTDHFHALAVHAPGNPQPLRALFGYYTR